MEAKELKDQLAELKSALETKTAEEVKSQMAEFEEKYSSAVKESSDELKEELKKVDG